MFSFLLHTNKHRCPTQLAGAVAMNGDLSRAEILHREALSIMERTLDPDDPRIAEVLFNLSSVVGGQRGRLGETENILHRCLDAQKRLYGLGMCVFVCLLLSLLSSQIVLRRRLQVSEQVSAGVRARVFRSSQVPEDAEGRMDDTPFLVRGVCACACMFVDACARVGVVPFSLIGVAPTPLDVDVASFYH